MALANKVMGGGVPAGMALALLGDVGTGITTAGTVISTATDLTAAFNVIGTSAAASGVQLPAAAMIGDSVFVYNGGANYCYVYPDSASGFINQLAAGVGAILQVNTGCYFYKITSLRWYALLSA